LTEWRDDAGPAVDAFVAEHAAGLVYYTSAYRRFLLRLLDCRCASLIAWEDDDVAGVLPLLSMEGRFGTVLNSLPFFGSNGGVLARTAAAERALLDAFEARAGASSVGAATWIANPFAATAIPRHDIVDERISQWTDLADRDSQTGLPRGIESSAHRNVNKAKAEGITVRETPDGLDCLERMHRDNMARIGGREKPAAFFAAVRDALEFGRDWSLYVAMLAGSEIGALLLFHAATTVEYIMPGIVEEARSMQPTALLIAQAMRDAMSRGYRRWNWGGTWLSQDGVYRFKRKWGAQETRYRYFIKLNNERMLGATPAELAAIYPYFYSVPYSRLVAHEHVGVS